MAGSTAMLQARRQDGKTSKCWEGVVLENRKSETLGKGKKEKRGSDGGWQ